jgi:hypothetical protein
MVSAIIFAAHLMFACIIFTKKWQDDSISSAFINLSLIIILFAVGWSVTTSVVKLVFESEGLGLYYNSDDISLTLLTIIEFFFYKMYYKNESAPKRNNDEIN